MSERAVMGVIEETYGALAEAVDSSLRHETPDNVRHALQENAFIFSGFKTYHSLREVGLSLTDEKGDIKPFDAFLGDVKRINELYNHNYLYAEYNHAVASALMADKWKQYEADGDKYYLQYRTASDDRVRETHRALHGTTLPLSDTFWDSFFVPNGWNCRCDVVQVRKEDYQPSDHDLSMLRGNNVTEGAKNAIFRFNPGKTLRLFPPKHPYFPKNCGECKRNLTLAYSPSNEKCKACLIIREQQRRHENRRLYEQLKKDPDYTDVEFDETTGGVKATHIGHNFDEQIGKYGIQRGEYEKLAANALYAKGHTIKLIKEDFQMEGVKQPDGYIDGRLMDIKGIEGNPFYSINRANKQKVDVCILYFHKREIFNQEKVQHDFENFENIAKAVFHTEKRIQKHIKEIICVINLGKGKYDLVFIK